MKIAILGAGAFGTALGGILADNGYDIDYYDSRVEKERLTDVLSKAKYVILCVPSKASPYVLPHLPKNIPLIVATKGILSGKPFAKFKDWMVLSGPGFADDIKAHQDTTLTVSDARVSKLFEAEYMHFEQTNDAGGILMCGALKNVYAMLAGLWNLKRDTREWLQFIDGASQEMRRLLDANNAKAATVDLACGIGDLKLTCGYPSRNYEYGDLLRQNPGYAPTKTVEGLSALKRIERGEIIVPEGLKLLKEVQNGFEC